MGARPLMKDYKVITAFNPADLEKKVLKYLEIGYTVTGGAFYADLKWCQVVIL
jgi:hypothetical protein